MAAPTFFGVSTNPADTGSLTEPQTGAVLTPPASMQTGDLVLVFLINENGSAGDGMQINNTGGQTWTSDTTNGSYSFSGSAAGHRLYWCTFNGTWSANPTFDFPAKAGTRGCGMQMLVFRPDATDKTWSVDTAPSWAGYSAPTTPFTVTITGLTPTNADTVTVARWASDDDNTWDTLSGTGWSKTGLGAQYANTGGSDLSTTYAYNLKGTASATNNVSQNQATLGGDAGSTCIVCFYAVGVLTSKTASETAGLPKVTEAVVTKVTEQAQHLDSLIATPTEAAGIYAIEQAQHLDSLAAGLAETATTPVVAIRTSDDVGAVLDDPDIDSIYIQGLNEALTGLSEDLVVNNTAVASESLVAGLTENSLLKEGLTASDDLAAGIDEASRQSLTLASSDSLPVGLTEDAAIAAMISTSDDLAAGLAEDATLAAVIAASEELHIGLTETGTQAVPGATPITGSESIPVGPSEDALILASVSAAEDLTGLAEDVLPVALIASADDLSAGLTETATPAATIVTSDTLPVGLTEDLAIAASLSAAEDLTGLSEDALPYVSASVTDSFPGFTENTTLDAGGVTGISSSESLHVGLSEDTTLLANVSVSESLTGLSEDAAPYISLSTSDTLSSGLTESAVIVVVAAGSDSLTVQISDDQSAVAAVISSSESLPAGLVEDVTQAVTISTAESLQVMVDDLFDALAIYLATNDNLAVQLTETADAFDLTGAIAFKTSSESFSVGLDDSAVVVQHFPAGGIKIVTTVDYLGRRTATYTSGTNSAELLEV